MENKTEMRGKTLEKLSESYAEIHMEKFDLVDNSKLPYFHNDRHKLEDAFEAGYLQKTAEIKDLIEKLEMTKMTPSLINTKVIKLYNEEQDRRINLLKILL